MNGLPFPDKYKDIITLHKKYEDFFSSEFCLYFSESRVVNRIIGLVLNIWGNKFSSMKRKSDIYVVCSCRM